MRHDLEQGRYELQVRIPFELQNFSSHRWGADGKGTDLVLCLPIPKDDAIYCMISKPYTFQFWLLQSPKPILQLLFCSRV